MIALIGVLLAAFLPTFLREIRLSKVAEATDELARLHQATAAYYEQSRIVGGRLRYGCLPESAGPTPVTPTKKRELVDFVADTEPGRETWRALGLLQREGRFSYQVEVLAPGCGPRADVPTPLVIFRALGDLDGDGERSLVEREAAATSDQRHLVPIGVLKVERRVE